MQILAIDWSGRAKGAAEHIWLAEVRDGRLVDLWNGAEREQMAADLRDRGEAERKTVVGLDFAFSFPRWWCRESGWSSVDEVWRTASEHGEEWLSACPFPFWGRPQVKNPHIGSQLYRRTDTETPGSAKSVFQVGGAGAVGTGSIRGMPVLAELAESGFSIWPFAAGWPLVVEIYPRALTGPVDRGRWKQRHGYLQARFADQDQALIERAAGSEDAFDAAVSALVMARHASSLEELHAARHPDYLIEGRIWRPARSL
jgi:hypothetical protein